MDKQVKFRKPVFGAGAPKTNGTKYQNQFPDERQAGRSRYLPESTLRSYASLSRIEPMTPASPVKSHGVFRLAPIVICSSKTQTSCRAGDAAGAPPLELPEKDRKCRTRT
jgi:hypothetical protein